MRATTWQPSRFAESADQFGVTSAGGWDSSNSCAAAGAQREPQLVARQSGIKRWRTMRTRRPIPRRTDNLVRHEFYISPRRDGQNCPSYELAREKRRILGS